MSDLDLQQWVGRTEFRTDVLRPGPVLALAATLDDRRPAAMFDLVPQGGHWFYFLDGPSARPKGVNGEPVLAGLLPHVDPRGQVWVGGRVDFMRPLRVGDAVRRESHISNVEAKMGATGPVIRVTIGRRIVSGDTAALVEEQYLELRAVSQPGGPLTSRETAPAVATWCRDIDPQPGWMRDGGPGGGVDGDHIDAAGCTLERVVDGALQATWMLDLCRRRAGRAVKRLHFNATSPLFIDRRIMISGEPRGTGMVVDLWTANACGPYAMRAVAYL